MEVAALGNSEQVNQPATPEELGLTAKTAGGTLGKTEFLQLLTTQMQYQDPLNPMDSTQMIAQLAQFSALEQMQNLSQEVQTARHESGLMLAGALTGQSVALTLADGSTQSGVVEGTSWTSNGLCLTIGGATYALSDIKNLALISGTGAQTGG